MVRMLCFVIVMFGLCVIWLSGCAEKGDLERGKDAMAKGEYAQALQSLSRALKNDSFNPEIHYNLCLAYAALDSNELSLMHYSRIVELGSELGADRELRGLMATLLGIESYPSSIIPMQRMNQFKGAFSPKGDVIAIAASRRDRADLYLCTLDGSDVRRVVSGGMNTDPVFSPDGNAIAFVSDRDGDEDLYLYDRLTTDLKKLTDNSAQDFAPAFSPDGGKLAFVSNMDDPNKWEIYVVSIQNGKIARLTDNNYWDGFPKFTANGQSIVFSSKRGKSEDIYVMRLDGGGLEVLFSSPADDNDPTLVREHLFFKSEMDGEWEVYRYNVMNRQLIRLTNNEWPDWNPRVSQDGSLLMLARRTKQRWTLHVLNVTEPVSPDFIVSQIRERQ
ncbi:MAG: PD40 domain-containing protein [candidate division WOR-3 bacterium]|nr:MAG: PD40 domain-containing protein [candidate division WOR-3 bacterium]